VSVSLLKRRLATLIGHRFADLRQFDAGLMHHGVDVAADHHVTRTARGYARQMRQRDAARRVEQSIGVGAPYQHALPVNDQRGIRQQNYGVKPQNRAAAVVLNSTKYCVVLGTNAWHRGEVAASHNGGSAVFLRRHWHD
jgi:hypothetical protein